MLEISSKSIKSVIDTRLPALFINDEGKREVITKAPHLFGKYFKMSRHVHKTNRLNIDWLIKHDFFVLDDNKITLEFHKCKTKEDENFAFIGEHNSQM